MSFYTTIKNIFLRIFPRKWLWKLEFPLRSIYSSLFFRGDKVRCNVCDTHFNEFILLPNGEKLCPKCGSLPRQRRLWFLWENLNIPKGSKILHFSPSRTLGKKFRNLGIYTYHTSDFEAEFPADFEYDLTNIAVSDAEYDIIICYHVLEHIPDDAKAMQELYRVLRKGGKVLIQTPFQAGEIYEDFSITTPEGRLQHFGQADHVRIYSVQGLKARLEKVGFKLAIMEYKESEKDAYFGLKVPEYILIAEK
jgi:hypothetical protein